MADSKEHELSAEVKLIQATHLPARHSKLMSRNRGPAFDRRDTEYERSHNCRCIG